MPVRLSRSLSTALVGCALVGVGALASPASASAGDLSGPDKAHHGGHGHAVIFPTRTGQQARVHTAAAQAAAGSGPLTYDGAVDGIGVTTGPPKVYVVFWGAQWGTPSTTSTGAVALSGDPRGVAPRIQGVLKGLGTNNETWSGVMTQYCQGVATGSASCPPSSPHVGYPQGGALAGVWADRSRAAPPQATGAQLAAEAVTAAGHFGQTSPAANRNNQYVIVSPAGTHPDGFGTNTASGNFCAWHDWNGDTAMSGGAASSPYGDIAFTNLPYLPDLGSTCGANYVNPASSGALDGVSIVEGHEYAETITDQNPLGGWTDSAGYENGDKCAWVGVGGTGGAQNIALATGTFPMQATWSNDANACQISRPVTRAAAPATPIAVRYAAIGGAASVLGTPVGGEYAVTGGTAQNYTQGRMYYSPATGAHVVRGAILARYLTLGGPAGALRLPSTDQTGTPDRIGRYNQFSAGAAIYWTPATSAHAVLGAIRVRWSQLGAERSPLGYPTTDEYSTTGGRRSDFQHGTITWTAATGATSTTYH